MPKLLKPIKITDNKYLIKIFGQCLEEEDEWTIVDQELGSPERGIIDLLGVDPEKRPYLITISHIGIEEGLARSFRGYRWYRENQPILKRIFPAQDINYDLSARLVLFIEHAHPDAVKIARDICKVPISDICKVPIILYRYICFGPEDDPLLYIELLDSLGPTMPREKMRVKPAPETPPSGLDIAEIKRKLKIELVDLSEKEIEEFLNLDLP